MFLISTSAWIAIAFAGLIFGLVLATLRIVSVPSRYNYWKNVYDQTVGALLRRRRERTFQLRVDEENAATLRQIKGQVRTRWAREEFGEKRRAGFPLRGHAYARVGAEGWDLEGGGPELPLTTNQVRRTQAPVSFQHLPAELRLEIYRHLDYGQALSLQRVSRFLRDDLPYEGVDMEQRATYTFHAETFKSNSNKLACFGCLRLRPVENFSVGMHTGKFERFGELELDRRCCTCETQDPGIRPSRRSGGWKMLRLR